VDHRGCPPLIDYTYDTSTRCLVPAFDGAILSLGWKEALWDKFFMAAPRRQRRSVEQYKIVKRTRSVTAYQKPRPIAFRRSGVFEGASDADHCSRAAAGSPSRPLRKSPAQFPIRPYVFVCCTKIWSR